MLDIFMASFMLVALWLWAGAVRSRRPRAGGSRWPGMALGLSMAAKWNAVPWRRCRGLAPPRGAVRAAGLRALTARRGRRSEG